MANSINGQNIFSRTRKRIKNTVSDFFSHPETVPCDYLPEKYSYIFRKKSRWELTRVSSIVCGIEFCYAAETAFVTPVLLSLGLDVKYVSMIWCLSPLLAFILTPILGSLSDSCRSRFGRRRPFIFMLSVGIIIGLIFVPYGGRLGILLGDKERAIKEVIHHSNFSENNTTQHDLPHYLSLNDSKTELLLTNRIPNNTIYLEDGNNESDNESNGSYHLKNHRLGNIALSEDSSETNSRLFGIIITAIGTIFLDLCADICQSPSRAYLLDITLPSEQTTGLALFSLGSGTGAAVGYVIAAIKWDITLWNNVLEGQVIISFAILSSLFLIFITISLCSFPEIPLPILDDPLVFKEYQEKRGYGETENMTEMSTLPKIKRKKYSSVETNGISHFKSHKEVQENGVSATKVCGNNCNSEPNKDSLKEEGSSESKMSLKDYLKSIVFMPKSIRILCLTNFFFGMGVISYTIFFTDFVGECVFGGDPHAPKDSESYELYKEGVRFGSWGMAFSSLCDAIYSGFLEDLAKRFGTKCVYVGGALTYSVGMALMAITRHKVAVILLSSTAGVILTTFSTVPYMLLANYHSSHMFKEDESKGGKGERGIGTDVGTVFSVIVLSQCILSLGMGTVVNAVGSNVVIVCSAALFSFCGAISATQIVYLDN